jgi:DNA repair protein RecN (Recombination protein N)
MLTRLVIHDVVLIEKLALSLEPGLNVFTGETGAGKSIVLDALSLALGERSDASLVRAGAAQASVAAEFALNEDHPLFALAKDQGLSAENPIILRRLVGKDGKSRAFFNDQPIGVGLLKQFGETLLEIHGQFETHGLLNSGTHRGLLDAFAGLASVGQQTREAFKAWKETADRARQAHAARERARAEEEYLRAAASELEDLAPKANEAERLAAERLQLQHREKIAEALNAATLHLDSERGALGALSQAGKAIARASDKAEGLSEILAAVDRALNEASEASQQLAHYLSSLDVRGDALENIEERLFSLRGAARKHNTQVDLLPDVLAEMTAKLSLLSGESEQIEKLNVEAAKARHAYVKLAQDLSAKRRAAASRLEKEVNVELPPLKLERARIIIEVMELPEDQWGEEGADRVTFLASTNAGTASGPLQKIASGGELSRFMLALKTVLAAADPVPVLVFDEVDTGIGGATASAVGDRLAALAQNVQILVVTHSPQVAARGTSHIRVAKTTSNGKTVTCVDVLDQAERREEIARMLAGSTITEAARQAADSLLVEPTTTEKQSRKAKKRA